MQHRPTILSGGEERSDDQIIAAHNARRSPGAPGGTMASEDESPLVLMELMQRLRVRDVMRSHDIISVVRTDSMRFAQNLMKRNNISGVPVLEENRLFGIVSVNDIIKALEGGWIHDEVQKRMATNLVVLEADMPLTFAIKHFQNYSFGRFPVLDKDRNFVGIVSQRDLTRVLMNELTKELVRLEGKAVRENTPAAAAGDQSLPFYSMNQFVVVHNDLQNAGKAANEIKRMMKDSGLDNKLVRRVAVAAYELEINVCIHSLGGSITFILDKEKATVIAKDRGPGIADVEWACRDGTSTANDWIRSMGFGAGMGLANSRRVSDKFDIQSKIPTGTTVICEFNIKGSKSEKA